MRFLKALLSFTTALVVVLMATPALVFAIADPDTPPEIRAAYVYEDLLEDGDVGVLVEYYINYAVLPSETATEAYTFAFIDIDGITHINSTEPYSYEDSGYGHGLVWMYFTAAQTISYSLSSTDAALYSVKVTGNPTVPSGWLGALPEATAGVTWLTSGDHNVLLTLRVLDYAEYLESVWGIDVLQPTPIGNRLTTIGAAYFQTVIDNLRTMAPNAFAEVTVYPDLENIDYTTTFSAVATSGTTCIIAGSPQTLNVGANTVNSGATVGTFTITLSNTATGTIADGTGTFVGASPSNLTAGVNTITVDGAGTFTVTLTQTDLQTAISATTTGTGFDVSAGASLFGMTTGVLSTAVWLILGVVLVAASYGGIRGTGLSDASSAGKTSMFLYGIWMIAGMLLGVLLAKIMCFLFIGYGAFIGYIMFYRNSSGDTGRNVAFMGWMWVVVCLVGGILNGMVPQASTHLTVLLTEVGTTVTVVSTEGFREAGIIVIDGERIAYSDTTATTFVGTGFRPMVRGTDDTEAAVHLVNATVRMPESSLINDSMSYRIALITDSAGIMSFITVPLAIFNIITDFLFLPLSFIGTDLVIITILWGVIALGVVITFFVAMAGGRRV